MREVRNNFSEVIEGLEKTGPVIVTINGKGRALLIAIDEDIDIETLVLSNSRRFWQLFDKASSSERTRMEDLPAVHDGAAWARVPFTKGRKRQVAEREGFVTKRILWIVQLADAEVPRLPRIPGTPPPIARYCTPSHVKTARFANVNTSRVQCCRLREGASMTRDALHDLVNRIPEEELPAATRFLEYLTVSPAYCAALTASLDDEPVTAGDARAIAVAREDLRDGRVSSHEEILDEFGLR